MLQLNYDYESCVKNSERVAWALDDALPTGTNLDFSRTFLPEELVLSGAIACLDAKERLAHNQIAAHSYVNLFAFVEEYILATMAQHASAELFGDPHAIRALSRFVDEEVKHQQLFARYKAAFVRDFGHPCQVLDSAVPVAGVIMSKSPIAVLLTTLHIELMTLQHYVECVKDRDGLDPVFAKLLHLHWLEESQHAKIDALELDKLLDDATPAQIEAGFADYLDIITAFDGLLAEQAKFDLASLSAAVGRVFTAEQAAEIVAVSHRAYRKTFLVYGMTNPTFETLTRQISPEARARIDARVTELA